MSELLRAALRAEGGPLADHLGSAPDAEHLGSAPDDASAREPGPPQIAASGPRAAGRESKYELLLEMILEGSRLHYGGPTVIVTDDRDLALLLGDQLYALGLTRLAALADLDAVAELADIISLVAQAHADRQVPRAAAIWEAGAAAIGWGPSDEHEAAKMLARSGDERSVQALRAAAAGRNDPGRSL